MMNLFLEPIDVWLFRDGRPFTAEINHRADSLFPPFPSVIQGAVRSNELVLKQIDLSDREAIEFQVGSSSDYKNLRLRGPFLARRCDKGKRITRFFPQPADAVSAGTLKIKPCQSPKEKPDYLKTSGNSSLLLGLGDDPEKGDSDLWLDEVSLGVYLSKDGAQEVEGTSSSELFQFETRPGIVIQKDTSTTLEGGFYEVRFVRLMPGVGLNVIMDGYNWGENPSGVLKLGGESRAARYSAADVVPWLPPPNPLPTRFKIYFATPAYFSMGWVPDSWELFFSGKVRMVSAALGKYIQIGGRDMTQTGKDAHRSARRYVPPGSVYYFESASKEPVTFNERTKSLQHAITEVGAEIGYGQVVVKEW